MQKALPAMSFDLAFWVGPAPVSHEAAALEFERLYNRYAEGEVAEDPDATGEESEPHPRLLEFLQNVTETYPDLMGLPNEDIDDGVWSDGPLTGNVTGPLLYLGIRWSRAEEMAEFLVERATAAGLVIFDPQEGKLLSPRGRHP